MRYLLHSAAALLLVCLVLLFAPTPKPNDPVSDVTDYNQFSPLAVCFNQDTDPEYVAEWTRRLLDRAGSLDYNLGGRWSNTAHGTGGVQGDKVILTYSFVPDGTSIEGDPSVLFARMNEMFGTPQVWQGLFAQVFERWGEVTGNSYEMVSDDGAAWGQNSPGVIGVRGDVRIASTQIDGGSGVLAYNFFPNRGDMVLDAAESWNNPTQNYIFLRNVVAHEHGHGIGIEHVCPIASTKLLEPFYTPAFEGPQHDDILAGQRGYGDPFEPNDDYTESYDLGAITGIREVQLASLDDETDSDWWRFTVVANRSLTITVEPDGYTYLEGQQNGDGSCEAGTTYNTADNQNLNIALYAGPDTTFLISADDHGVGYADELFRYDVPANVTDLKLHVSGATTNSIQLYRLRIESVDPATPYVLGCPLEIDTTLQGLPALGALVLANPLRGNVLDVSSVSVTGPFTVSPTGPFQLQPNTDAPITITFNAENLGSQSGTLTVNHSGPGGPITCEVSGTAITSGLVFFTGALANFGDVSVNHVDSVLVGLRAEGNIALTINSITTSAPFSVSFDGPVSIQPGPLLRVYPRVVPTQLGETRGWLIINHSAVSSPDSIELVVNGTPDLGTDDPLLLPTEFALYQNYPNPFNPTTKIDFDLPTASQVSLKLYNVQGQLVREIVNGQAFTPGRHTVELNATELATGVYVYRLEASTFRSDRKLLLMK